MSKNNCLLSALLVTVHPYPPPSMNALNDVEQLFRDFLSITSHCVTPKKIEHRKNLKQKKYLNLHIQSKHETIKYKCPDCDKIYSNKGIY